MCFLILPQNSFSCALFVQQLPSFSDTSRSVCEMVHCAAQADYPLAYWPGVVLTHTAMAIFEVRLWSAPACEHRQARSAHHAIVACRFGVVLHTSGSVTCKSACVGVACAGAYSAVAF